MNKDEQEFLTILQKNEKLMQIADDVATLHLQNWYIAAGCVFQTLWNAQDQKSLMSDVHDIDLVYFDDKIPSEKSVSADRKLEEALSAQFGLKFDVHNEAYMHLWHGRDISPYSSCENAMTRWLATVHAVGITGNSQNLTLYAPFGLDDIFSRTIRPIYHKDNNRVLYEAKVAKWSARFAGLTVMPWDESKI